MRFSPAFLIALCASPLLFRPASAQTTAQTLNATQLLAPSSSIWGRPLTPTQNRQRAQQSLLARDRAFEWLEGQAGAVEAPNFNLLSGRGDLEGWTWNRYRAVTGDETLTRRQREAMIAGVVHQDLQLAEVGLSQSDEGVRRRALRVASIASLYAGMVPADPRLQGALYEGFLLPNLELAPARGWSGAGTMLEGASVAFRRSGRVRERREVLLTLLERQTAQGDAAGADVTRVHLADAFAAEGFYQNAIETLQGVNSPDVRGARAMLTQLGNSLTQSNQANKRIWESARQAVVEAQVAAAAGTGGATTTALAQTPPTGATPPGGATAQGDAATPDTTGAAGAPGAIIGGVGAGGLDGGGTGTAPVGIGRGGTGPRVAQGGGGAPNAATEGGTTEAAVPEEARPGESEKMRRVRLAAEAAQRAQELSRDAQEKATIALALLLDAAEAQAALEAAEAGRAPAKPTRARPAGNAAATATAAAPPVSLITLRQNAQNLARRASEAAGDAKRAAQAAQKASEEAADLALRVFIVDQNTPKDGEPKVSPANVPATATPDVPVAREAKPGVQPAAPLVNQEPAAPAQTEAQPQ